MSPLLPAEHLVRSALTELSGSRAARLAVLCSDDVTDAATVLDQFVAAASELDVTVSDTLVSVNAGTVLLVALGDEGGDWVGCVRVPSGWWECNSTIAGDDVVVVAATNMVRAVHDRALGVLLARRAADG